MKFISLDLETTGLIPGENQILEIGAIAVDTKTHPSTWPCYHRIVMHEKYVGNAYALNLNNRLLKFISEYSIDPENVSEDWSPVDIENLAYDFAEWLKGCGYLENDRGTISITCAGKNIAGFDIPFMKQVPEMNQYINFVHRVIDPAVMYADFINDERVPDLNKCKQRAGIKGTVTHCALDDAWDIVMLICHKMGFDLNSMITKEWLDANYRSDFFKFKTGGGYPYWMLDDNTMIRFMEDCPNPFSMWRVENLFGEGKYYMWSTAEVLKTFPSAAVPKD